MNTNEKADLKIGRHFYVFLACFFKISQGWFSLFLTNRVENAANTSQHSVLFQCRCVSDRHQLYFDEVFSHRFLSHYLRNNSSSCRCVCRSSCRCACRSSCRCACRSSCRACRSSCRCSCRNCCRCCS